jgi:hypothetical protein
MSELEATRPPERDFCAVYPDGTKLCLKAETKDIAGFAARVSAWAASGTWPDVTIDEC